MGRVSGVVNTSQCTCQLAGSRFASQVFVNREGDVRKIPRWEEGI